MIEVVNRLRPGDALIVSDMQQDFLPGALLAVEGAGFAIEWRARSRCRMPTI